MFEFSSWFRGYMNSTDRIFRNRSKYIVALKIFLLICKEILFCLYLWLSDVKATRDTALNWSTLIVTVKCGILEYRWCWAVTATSWDWGTGTLVPIVRCTYCRRFPLFSSSATALVVTCACRLILQAPVAMVAQNKNESHYFTGWEFPRGAGAGWWEHRFCFVRLPRYRARSVITSPMGTVGLVWGCPCLWSRLPSHVY